MKVVKTTFEKEQLEKEEAWLSLTPARRWEIAYKIINSTRDQSINYSYKGLKVKVKRLS
jgi:hypothetical protein